MPPRILHEIDPRLFEEYREIHLRRTRQRRIGYGLVFVAGLAMARLMLWG